jgi:hypothetical protein
MTVKSRLKKLENATRSDNSIIFINAKETGDFRRQIESLIEQGLDPTGKKFVYVEDPLQSLYEQIAGKSGSLVRDDNATVNGT